VSEWWEVPAEDFPASMALVRVEVVQCVTDQWNFPFDRSMPFVSSQGVCTICEAQVPSIVFSIRRNHMYNRVARPHTRKTAIMQIGSDDLRGLIEYCRRW